VEGGLHRRGRLAVEPHEGDREHDDGDDGRGRADPEHAARYLNPIRFGGQ
jgi:hypothetical protein